MKKRKPKIYLVIALLFLEVLTITLTFKSYENKKLENTKEEYNVDNKMVGMYIESTDSNGNKTYVEYNDSSSFPEGYIINYEKSYCLDANNNILKDGLEGSHNTLIIAINKATYCYIYFDLEIKITEPYVYEYTGNVQEFEVPATGTYKLEVWGAQGGSLYGSGGKGGYSTGTLLLEKNDVLYIYVGSTPSDKTGGYNGGGAGGSTENNSGGGGATHVALSEGLLNDLSSNKDSLIIVAGGGGGGAYSKAYKNMEGASGGGLNGGSETASRGGASATQSSGYAFGLGGSATNSWDGSGGGGGYYGGYAGGNYNGATPGGGGSGYIGDLLNGNTISGSNSIPTHDGTGTMTGNAGNGYAKITYVE